MKVRRNYKNLIVSDYSIDMKEPGIDFVFGGYYAYSEEFNLFLFQAKGYSVVFEPEHQYKLRCQLFKQFTDKEPSRLQQTKYIDLSYDLDDKEALKRDGWYKYIDEDKVIEFKKAVKEFIRKENTIYQKIKRIV